MATTIRIKPESHKVLKRIARLTGRSVQQELDQAIEDRRRTVYLQGLAADYAALRKDEQAWQEHRAEVAAWDATSSDHLPPRG